MSDPKNKNRHDEANFYIEDFFFDERLGNDQDDQSDTPDMAKIFAIEKMLTDNVKLLIESALADNTASITTMPLRGRTHIVEEKMEIGSDKRKIRVTPAYTVRGLTYTDGTILDDSAGKSGPKRPVSLFQKKSVEIQDPTIVVVSEWTFCEREQNRSIFRGMPKGLNPEPEKGRFKRCISHTVFARDKQSFDHYIGYKLAKKLNT